MADAARRPPPVVARTRRLPHPANDNAAGLTRFMRLLPLAATAVVAVLVIGALWIFLQ